MCTETAMLICSDGKEREFELQAVFDYKEKTYGILFQKLKGEWEVDGEIFLIDDSEEEGAEYNYTVREIIQPENINMPLKYECISDDVFYHVMKKATEILNDDDYCDDSDEVLF